MVTHKIFSYLYNISLGVALVELVFLYTWLQFSSPDVEVLPNTPEAQAQTISPLSKTDSTDGGRSEKKAVFVAPVTLEKPQETKSFSVTVQKKASEEISKKVTQPIHQNQQVKDEERAVSSEKSKDAEQTVSSAEDRAYQAAAETAIWPEEDRPRSKHGMPVLYPKLVPICSCESSYSGTWNDVPRQYENGHIIMNYGGNDDVGMCQINLTQFGVVARSLGYNLFTPEGNINFANWLFENEGSAPWYKSKHCWKHAFE